METRKAEQACTLKLKFIKGQTAAGKDVYAMVTFPHVNPEVSDSDMYEVADLLGSLQARMVSGIVRVDSANLVAVG